MNLQILKSKIESLDPNAHRALRDALTAQYRRLTRERGPETPGPKRRCDTFEEMFREAANGIAEQYVCGTSEYIEERHPDLYRRTEGVDERMNKVWQAGRQGKASLDDFRAVLEEWQRLHLEQIDVYRRESKATKGSGSMCGES